MYKSIKVSLCELGKTQVWLIGELAKKGIKTNKFEMSAVISGSRTGPKAESIIKTSQKIINEYKEKLKNGS